VEFDYSAELNDELTLRVGDVITSVVRAEGGWWKGKLRGKEGVFPDNFVKVLPSAPVASHAMKPGEDVILRRKKRCRVLFSYQPLHEDELELKVDQLIDFMCEVEDGWWKGRSGGRVGVFPSNFVEMCNDDLEEKPVDKVNSSTVEAKNKKNSLGANRFIKEEAISPKIIPGVPPEKEEDKKVTVMTTSERFLLAGNKTPPDTAPRLPPKPVKEQCVVLFPYTAQNDDELSLEEGQVILILSRDVEDKGWWKGEIDGKTGVFPDNFVKLLSPEEERRDKKPWRPPPVAGEKVDTRKVEQGTTGKPTHNVNKLTMDLKSAFSSENLSRSSSIDLVKSNHHRGSSERLSDSRRSVRRLGEGDRDKGSMERLGRQTSGETHGLIHRNAEDPSKGPSLLSKESSSLGGKSEAVKNQGASRVSLGSLGAGTSQEAEAKDRRLSEPAKTSESIGGTGSGLDQMSPPSLLSHPTVGRVKAPKRRPPSQHFLKENIPDVDSLLEEDDPPSDSEPAIKSSLVPGNKLPHSESKSSEDLVKSGEDPARNSQRDKRPGGVAVMLPPTDPSPNSETKPSWLEELSRKQANRRSGVFTEPSSRAANKPEPPLAENKPNLPSKPSQVKVDEGTRKNLTNSSFSTGQGVGKKGTKAEGQENRPESIKTEKPTGMIGKPVFPAGVSKATSNSSLTTPTQATSTSVGGSRKDLCRRESERETEERNRRTSDLTRNPSDSSSSGKPTVHSTNLGKPATNLSFVAKPERPVVEDRGRVVMGNTRTKEVERKEVVIGWNPEVVEAVKEAGEKLESTNSNIELTNGGVDTPHPQQVSDLRATVMAMKAEFNLQLAGLRRDLEEEKLARQRLEQEVRALKKLLPK